MKKYIKSTVFLILAGTLISACSQQKEQSLESMIKSTQQQDKVLSILAENHELSSKYISEMMKNDHATGMMVDELVKAAAQDSSLAIKVSDMITKFPDLMLMTMHHFMPVINADQHMCDGFCDDLMEHKHISETMCKKMQENEEMSCCH